MDNQQERSCQLAYIAGLIDGEGYVSILKQKPGRRTKDGRWNKMVNGFSLKPIIAIHMKSERTIKHLAALSEELDLPYYITATPSKQSTWRWVVWGQARVIRWLDEIDPFLCTKKDHAICLRAFIESRENRVYGKGYTDFELSQWTTVKSYSRAAQDIPRD